MPRHPPPRFLTLCAASVLAVDELGRDVRGGSLVDEEHRALAALRAGGGHAAVARAREGQTEGGRLVGAGQHHPQAARRVDDRPRHRDALGGWLGRLAHGQDGAIGDVFSVDLTFHNAYGPDKPWFFDPRAAGGGCVMDLGIHLVDLLLWTLDSPKIERIESRLYRHGQRLERGSPVPEDFATAEVSFATGASARLACSWNLSAGCDAVISAVFHGTRGTFCLRNQNGSFYDFETAQLTGTQQKPISECRGTWGAVGICDWVARLASDPRFDASAHRFEEVHHVIDAIYGR